MKRSTNVFWSIVLSFVMVFILSVPSNVQASIDGGSSVLNGASDSAQSGIDSNPEGVVEPDVVPLLLAPVAASAFTSTVVNSIFAVALGWYVGYESQSLFQGAVNDKKYSSTTSYSVTTSPVFDSTFPEYIGTSLVNDSAAKHMPKEVVQELHNRVKNYSNEYNFRAYSSTEFPGNTMYVIDINSSLPTTVNRHLGNNIAGFTGYVGEDPNYSNETLDLAGYSIIIVSKKFERLVFHAHFTPQYLRNQEVEYNRYKGQFDVQTYPVRTQNEKYRISKNANHSSEYLTARNNRGLLLDTKGRPSVVPYR